MIRRLLYIVCAVSVALLSFADEHRAGYVVRSVSVEGIPAYLLIPDSAQQKQCPAVLLFHDHGAHFSIGKEKIVRPLWRNDLDSVGNRMLQSDAENWTKKFYSGTFLGDSLAHEGYVVLVTDALYWGEQALRPVAWNTATETELKNYNKALKQYQPTFYADCLTKYRKPWFEIILSEDMRALSYLLSLPYVDGSRVATVGFSMGAYRSWQLAAADSRVRACAAANWMGTAASMGGYITGPSSYSMFRPALYLPQQNRPATDYPAIAARIAPRPFLLMYGTTDPVCPIEGVRQAIDTIATEYTDSSTFVSREFPAAHQFTPAHYTALLDWLRQIWLKGK